jgi:hypothetical protein
MIRTVLLTPAQTSDYWHLVKGYLKDAIDHGVNETPIEFWLSRVLNLQAQLWVFLKDEQIVGAGLTQFIEYHTHKTLHLVLCGGIDWDEWADQYYVVEEFAKKNGCRAVEQWGRKGWTKLLPQKIPGFETVYYVMRKELNKDENQIA